MSELKVNKVVASTGETLIDLTSDTVTAANVQSGVTFHDRTGNVLNGTMATRPVHYHVMNPKSGGTSTISLDRDTPMCDIILKKEDRPEELEVLNFQQYIDIAYEDPTIRETAMTASDVNVQIANTGLARKIAIDSIIVYDGEVYFSIDIGGLFASGSCTRLLPSGCMSINAVLCTADAFASKLFITIT